MIAFTKIPKLIKNPGALVPCLKDLVVDLANDLREWPYPHKLIVIAGLPKSGTNWLWHMLCDIPGYNPCPGVLRPMKLTKEERWNHDLNQTMFDAIPKDKFTVVKTHTRPTLKNFQLLENNNARVILLVRDLRQVAVSRFFHEKTDRSSWCYKRYNLLPFEDAFWHNLFVMRDHYIPWLKGWRIAGNPCTNLITGMLGYEYILSSFSPFVSWLGIQTNSDWIIEKSQYQKSEKNNLEFFLNTSLPARHTSTYSGAKRDWREYFTKEQEAWFRKQAEDVMLEYEYAW